MKSMRSRVFILISIIIPIEGERWYSAALTENQSQLNPEQFRIFRTNYLQDAEHQYLPLNIDQKRVNNEWQTIRYGNFTNKETLLFNSDDQILRESSDNNGNLSFNETKDSFATTFKPPNSETFSDLNYKSLRQHNNTLNVNKLNNTRRRVIRKRKRCPAFNPRRKKQVNPKEMKKRFLEIFEVVEFDHVPCTSSSGLEGTCLHESDCQAAGGAMMGTCADGYGTCCVIQFSCDDTTAALAGWFTNPGFPNPSSERLSCAVTINKNTEEIKQIRLDFLNFELLPPTAGTCEQDQFVVSGQNVNSIVPILCGVNTGLHVYIEVGDTAGPINLSVQTASADNRLFAIKVTQLPPGDDLAAPSGCLQYFKGSHGYLESFNYRDASDTSIAKAPSYLNNLNYAMCIEREPSSCSITYTNAGIMQILNYDSDGLPVIPPDQAGVEIFNCPSDWLLISAARLCGDRLNDGSVLQDFALNAPITDNGAGPIVVWFRSDEGYVGRGFKLQFQQNPCSP